MNKTWWKIQVSCSPDSMEAVENRLFELGALGTEEKDACVEAYFPGDVDSSAIQNQLRQYARELSDLGFEVGDASVEDVPHQNWNAAWQEHFKPVQVTDRLIVKPPWIEIEPSPEHVVIDIQPKMAFGTGTHETTQLCLQFLEKYIQKEMAVLDIGTGSVILAIASIRFGAQSATGVDIEEESIENAGENSGLNGTSGKTEFFLGSVDVIPAKKYDLILANVNTRVLSELLPKIVQFGNKDTIFVLSGILSEEEDKITQAAEKASLQILETNHLGEWMALALRKQ